LGDTFGILLRRHRLRLRLTQEALAERAELSSRSVAEMERGRGRSPRPRSVERLAAALELDGEEREEFVGAGQAVYWESRAGRPERDQPRSEAALSRRPVRHLPADLADFVGRDEELALLAAVLEPGSPQARVAVLSGPPGVGKTALAVHAGHRQASWFPDGQLYASLRRTTGEPADPADVLAQLLRALGVDGPGLPAGVEARAGLFRDRVATRRMLLVLDDAAGYHQVESLLPAQDVAVLVTSKLPLTGLPGATSIDLRPLPGPAAIALLCRVAGEDRIHAQPAAATELVAACGGLPLAVRIAAARLAARPHWTVATLNARLADERRRLDELRHGDLTVRPGLHLAYQGLTPAAARAFALLGELGVRSFPEWPVAALLDTDQVTGSTVLEELLDARLLEARGPDRTGRPRYGFHDITRLYARERREADVDESEWTAALAGVATGWLTHARRAQDHLQCLRFHLDDRTYPAPIAGERPDTAGGLPDPAATQPVEWFEAEREALALLVDACAEANLSALARSLAGCATDFYELRGYYDDWQRVTQVAQAACRRTGDRAGEAAMLRGLGSCLVESDHPETLPTLRAARALAEEVGDRAGSAMAAKEIGYMLSLAGSLDEAEAELRMAADRLADADRPLARAIALTSLGFVRRQRGDTADALNAIRAALAIARPLGDRFTEAYALRGLAGALLADGRHREAESAARRAASLFHQVGDPIGAAQSMRTLGEALAHRPDRLMKAERALTTAASLFRDHGYDWGVALTELSLGELEARRGSPKAAARLHRSLRYWTDKQVPALRARTLVALATAAERSGDPAARTHLIQAYELYQALGAPAAAELGERLGLAPSDDRAS